MEAAAPKPVGKMSRLTSRFGLTTIQKNNVLKMVTAFDKNVVTANFAPEWRISDAGIAFIKKREGLKLHAYPDKGGKLTIGYGHRIPADQEKAYLQDITPREAERLLRLDVEYACEVLNHCLRHLITKQSQFDSLCSFVFNIGSNAFLGSTLLADLQKGDTVDVPSELKRWSFVEHQFCEGLYNRRILEGLLFANGDYNG